VSSRRLSARDYKRTRRAGSTRLRDFGFGLALGLIIAGAVYVRAHRLASSQAEPSHPVPGARRTHKGSAEDSGPPDDLQSSTQSAADAAAASGTGAGTGGSGTAAGSAAPGVGGFDFYRMLPKFQVVVSGHERASHPPPAAAQIEQPGTYFLQVGSYRDDTVAEGIRSKLAKQGITATVQRVAVGTDLWHRVRVGPIRDLALLNRLRRQLQASNLDSLVVRVDN
jgi:cell division septation protein DedD